MADVITADVTAAALAISVAEAARHAAGAMPELIDLGRGGPRFERRFRPYLDEIIHCLASSLEAALVASRDGERAGIGGQRRPGEDLLRAATRDYLDRFADKGQC